MLLYCRFSNQINAFLLHYAAFVAITHRPDFKNNRIPTLFDYFPAKFIDSQVIRRAREKAVSGAILRDKTVS